jgi:hypothetical protein
MGIFLVTIIGSADTVGYCGFLTKILYTPIHFSGAVYFTPISNEKSLYVTPLQTPLPK